MFREMVATAILSACFVTDVSQAQTCGDLDDSGDIAATDALLLLNKAVDQPVPDLMCPLSVGLPVTGQSTCYDLAGGVVGCGGTGQDGELQLGAARSFTDNGDGTVTDNLTALMWEKNSLDGTIHDNSSGYLWHDAFAKIATLNGMAFAGYSDWRLPNAFELFTLVNLGVLPHGETTFPATDPAFNSECVPGCDVSACSCTHVSGYWTSSTIVVAPSHAYVVSFVDGGIWQHHKLNLSFVRAVRGGA